MATQVTRFYFANDLNVSAYLCWLMAEKLQYHFDDGIFDIVWNEREVNMVEQDILRCNHDRLIEYVGDIWVWFDKHPDMWEMWQDSRRHCEGTGTTKTGLTYINRTETCNTGGGCMVDILTLNDGRYIAVTDECIILYRAEINEDDFLDVDAVLADIDLDDAPSIHIDIIANQYLGGGTSVSFDDNDYYFNSDVDRVVIVDLLKGYLHRYEIKTMPHTIATTAEQCEMLINELS